MASNKYNAEYIRNHRNHAPGCVGGQEICDKATEDEICMLAGINDILADLQNEIIETKKLKRRLLGRITRR